MPYNRFLGDLLSYFGHKAYVAKGRHDDYLKEIEKELKIFKRLKEENRIAYDKIINKLEIQFIQHSLNLEGNPITISETISLLRDQIVPRDMKLETIQEVENYQKAVIKMVRESESKALLTKESVLNYHYLTMFHKPWIAGKIRKVKVCIRNNPNFKVCPVGKIEEELDRLIAEYNEFIRKDKVDLKGILEFAAYFHNQFQYIHPFEDGNSRTTRLLTFHLLRGKGIPVIDIPLGLLDEYLDATKGYKKREDDALSQVLQKAILYNLKIINGQLRE